MAKQGTELEFCGVKLKGSKMFLYYLYWVTYRVLFGERFVFYKDYLDMKEQIHYTA